MVKHLTNNNLNSFSLKFKLLINLTQKIGLLKFIEEIQRSKKKLSEMIINFYKKNLISQEEFYILNSNSNDNEILKNTFSTTDVENSSNKIINYKTDEIIEQNDSFSDIISSTSEYKKEKEEIIFSDYSILKESPENFKDSFLFHNIKRKNASVISLIKLSDKERKENKEKEKRLLSCF